MTRGPAKTALLRAGLQAEPPTRPPHSQQLPNTKLNDHAVALGYVVGGLLVGLSEATDHGVALCHAREDDSVDKEIGVSVEEEQD